MKLVLTGATGFTGGEVLRQILVDPDIERVAVLTRRALSQSHPKLDEILVADFLDYSAIDFTPYDACIWCLGISQASVSEETYIEITHNYTVAAAEAMFAASPALRFCFVSGRGADQDEQARSLFGRIKGRTERRLAEFGPAAASFRPAYIRPTRATGPRRDFARFLAPIGSLMAWYNEDLAVDCDQLARCLIGVAKQGSAVPVLTNRQIRSWLGEDPG